MADKRFPLSWPQGRPRTPANQRKRAAFGTVRHRTGQSWASKQHVSMAEAIGRLQSQLDLLRASQVILSTNVELRLDGLPRSGNEPADPGVALYFRLKGRDTVFACDQWDRAADNVTAIAKHIEALRGMDRWGTGTLEQAFMGYQSLPAPEQWWQVLGVGSQATRAEIETAYRAQARSAHPDTGGTDAAMARLNAARDEGLRACEGNH